MGNEKNIVKLKLDVVFKKMFGDENNVACLRSFLASMLELPEQSIHNIVMRNSEIFPEDITNKFSRMDLSMEVDQKQINVEMQVGYEKDFRERTLFYWSSLYSSALKSGEPYGNLPETICINIVNFNLFESPEFHSHFKLMEKSRHEILTDKIALHFFELKKIGKVNKQSTPMELWLQLVNAETEEELSMLEQTNVKEIQDAVMIVRRMSADEKIREMAKRRELALHEEASALSGAREEGRVEGENRTLELLKSMGISEEILKEAQKKLQSQDI